MLTILQTLIPNTVTSRSAIILTTYLLCVKGIIPNSMGMSIGCYMGQRNLMLTMPNILLTLVLFVKILSAHMSMSWVMLQIEHGER